MSVVIDTNVIVVADTGTPQASPGCVTTSAQALADAAGSRVSVDASNEILTEYARNVSQSRPLGDAFVLHLYRNGYNPDRCERVSITPHPGRSWEQFPDDPDLAAFDRSDRKFVAVSRASAFAPKILNAADTDWWLARSALARNGVEVCFLCPELMRDGA